MTASDNGHQPPRRVRGRLVRLCRICTVGFEATSPTDVCCSAECWRILLAEEHAPRPDRPGQDDVDEQESS